MKRIIPAVAAAVAAAAGLTACSAAAPAAAPASHQSVKVPVSCSQQYNTWNHSQGKGLITALDSLSSAETAGNTQVLAATLKNTRSAFSSAARHPVPACADPAGYWNVLLMHVTAAAHTGSASTMQAAMKGVPKIDHQLTAELKAL